jgi:hypothetical protein
MAIKPTTRSLTSTVVRCISIKRSRQNWECWLRWNRSTFLRTTHRNARVNSGLERWLHVSTITYGALVGVNTGRTRGHPPIDPRSERTLHSRGAGPLIRCFFLTQWPDEHRCSGPAPLSAANNSRPSNSSFSFRNRSCNTPSEVSIERPAKVVGVQSLFASKASTRLGW